MTKKTWELDRPTAQRTHLVRSLEEATHLTKDENANQKSPEWSDEALKPEFVYPRDLKSLLIPNGQAFQLAKIAVR